MSGKTMALNVIHKINVIHKFLHCKNDFLTTALRCLLCDALMQPHFDYACSAWYPNLTKKLKHILPTTQNMCMHFRLLLVKLKHISHVEFQHLIWLPKTYRLKTVVLNCTIVFKDFNKQCPNYLNEVFDVARENNF